MDNIAALDTLVSGASRISAAVHIHPDGDALGSGLALVSYLTRMRKKDAVLIVPEEIPESLAFIIKDFRNENLIVSGSRPDEARRRIASSDLIFCLDCPSFSRTDPAMDPVFRKAEAEKVLIDHHLNPERDSFGLIFSKTDVSSASELLYQILKEMPDVKVDPGKLPGTCLRALMTGMTTDTNNFANSVFPTTLEMASDLLEAGVDRDGILSDLYHNYRENRLRLMGYLLYENMKITPEGVAFMILDKATQERFDFRHGESEGFVNQPLAIANVRMSILLTEEEDRFRVSVRSKKGTSANQCAIRYFNGGGHEMAAGGKLFFPENIPSPGDAEAYILKVSEEFLGK